MKLEYQLTEEDILNFYDFHYKHSKVARRIFWQHTALCIISFFVVVMFLLLLRYQYQTIHFFIALVLSLTICILYTSYYKSYIRRYSQKFLNEGENRELFTPTILELTQNSIKSLSKQSETKLNWDAIERIENTKDYIFLYNSAVSAIIIPKNKVKTDIRNHDIFKEIQDIIKNI